MLSLITFDANDPSLNHVISNNVATQNKAGLLGAYASGFLNDVFGIVAFVWPIILGATSLIFLSAAQNLHWWRWLGFFLLTLCMLLASSAWDFAIGDLTGGGMVGSALYKSSIYFLSPFGASLLWLFIFMIGIQLVANLSWLALCKKAFDSISEKILQKQHEVAELPQIKNQSPFCPLRDFFKARFSFENIQNFLGNIRKDKDPIPELLTQDTSFPPENQNDQQLNSDIAPQSAPIATPVQNFSPATTIAERKEISQKNPEVQKADEQPVSSGFSLKKGLAKLQNAVATKQLFPSIGILEDVTSGATADLGKIKAMGQALMSCLQDFSVDCELVRTTPGPVVTLFEVLPARGTRVNKIANLGDDLARSLKASAIRILAPVPHSDTVGIEIPNATREGVSFKDLVATDIFKKGCGPLTIILGKDTSGAPYLSDLTTMPHMLIGGATGQGKSVCLNSILASFLFRVHPDNLKLLLIDPKRVELSVYADEPHLVHPVVTEIEDAKNALLWATQEMDRRFKALACLSARNINEYNKKLATNKSTLPPDLQDLEPLPYLVIVIDELADLMLTARKEVEGSLVRLAQLARAAGIHMILATQRPSHEVVTGLIKANFPCRISFTVTSRFDSRTILDQDGAEKLVGRGDMLFKSGSGKVKRLHGPFLSDEDVQRLVQHWKDQMKPSYQVDFSNWGSVMQDFSDGDLSGGSLHGDTLYAEAQAFVLEQGVASISKIQRRFQIGFNRAARIVEQLEQDGIIGPANGSKPRTIIR